MSSADRIAASRTVAATPAEVFLIVTDPAMHVEIDGSGMLEAAPGAQRLRGPGDTFEMEMDREPLGDRRMGKYKSRQHGDEDRPRRAPRVECRLARTRARSATSTGGRSPRSARARQMVTNYCEWPDIPEFARPHFPIVPLAMLEKSVDNLAALSWTTPAPRRCPG